MKKKISTIVIVTLSMVCSTNAALIFDSGYNIFDDTYPYYDEVGVNNDAHLDFLSGEVGKLVFMQSATGSIYGGQIDILWTGDSAIVNIYGGSLNTMASSSTVYLHAYDTIHHSDGGLYNQPWLEGFYYSDDTYFSFTFYSDDCIPQLTIVPEPATMLFLGLGCLFLRRKK